MRFYKYQGTGNDFVLIDDRQTEGQNRLSVAQISNLCNRKFGIGADGLMLLRTHPEMDFEMVYYNSDGNESSMCGNGGRCIVAFAKYLGIEKELYRFWAIDGEHTAFIKDEKVHLQMSRPKDFTFIDSNQFWLDTGSPHYVQICEEDVATLNVKKAGAAIRYSFPYREKGTNVNFMNILERGKLKVRTYERGVEDETLSCGTGVTACAYTYILWNNAVQSVSIETLGGTLGVEVKQLQTTQEEVWLIGRADFVFSGEIAI